MRTPLLASALVILGLLAACSDDATAPTAQPADTVDPGSSGEPAPAPTGTTTGTAVTPPGAEWTPPVVATTSPACGSPMADASGVDLTTPSGRTFHVWGPSGYDPNKRYPVVFVFHGIQASGDAHESWFKMEDYTNNEAFVVYPDAVKGFWDVSGSSDLTFFDEMVKQIGEAYCINPSRVLGFGFSYGGHFADHLGCKRAGYVKAIAVGDGGPSGDGNTCGRLPVLVTTRSNDTNEYPSYGRTVASNWTTNNKCGAAGDKQPQNDNGEDMGYCVTSAGCQKPGALTYCEDTSAFPAGSPSDWNHTVREYYRSYVYKWFKALP